MQSAQPSNDRFPGNYKGLSGLKIYKCDVPPRQGQREVALRQSRILGCLLLCAAVPSLGTAGTAYYSIGPDSTFSGPQGFYSVSAGGATWLFDISPSSLGFNGGLAYQPSSDQFFAIGNDFTGSSSLVSFSRASGGAITTINSSLGIGFLSGLAYNSADGFLYGISTDFSAFSTLKKISTAGVVTDVGALGFGFYGGLAFNPDNGLLYAFAGDSFGVQRELYSIDPASGAATFVFGLGDGSASFNGGLAYDPADQMLRVISNSGFLGTSAFHTFALSGPVTLSAGGGLGSGFINVGLVGAPDGGEPPVPEPSMSLAIAIGLLAGVMLGFRTRCKKD